MQRLCEFQEVCWQQEQEFQLIDILFHITHKPDADLKKQRITKNSKKYREKKTIFDELEANGSIERAGLDAARNEELVSEFISPIIILPTSDTYKIVIAARLLNAITDVFKYHFPLLPGDVLIPRVNGIIFSTSNLSPVYHQVALTLKTQSLVHCVVVAEQYNLKRGFYGLKAVPGSCTRVMTMLSCTAHQKVYNYHLLCWNNV